MDTSSIVQLQSSTSALATAITARQTFDYHASIGSAMGRLVTFKCGDTSGRITRRDFLKLAGAGLLASGGVGLVSKLASGFLSPEGIAFAQGDPPDRVFAGTDG